MLNQLSGYKNKTALITGNTGFKGSWMTMMLLRSEAKVVGYSLEPEVNGPPIYDELQLGNKVKQYIKDIRSFPDIKECIRETKPDIIFHLAAQPLVRESYNNPVETFDINVMGTAHLLEAVRELDIDTNIVCITSDKSYENQEWLFGYRETDPLGGHDPYSASKGASELIISSFRESYFKNDTQSKQKVKVASVRAGNVIGGGDWADDRIVPDCIRSLEKGESIFVRNPHATRPWQHVLEPTGGYLLLGAKLLEDDNSDSIFCGAFNFGPTISSNCSVQTIVKEIIKNWESGEWYHNSTKAVHEASLLNLSIDKAYHLLNWHPVWDFEDDVKYTVEWYKERFNGGNMFEFTNKQIDEYFRDYQSSEMKKKQNT